MEDGGTDHTPADVRPDWPIVAADVSFDFFDWIWRCFPLPPRASLGWFIPGTWGNSNLDGVQKRTRGFARPRGMTWIRRWSCTSSSRELLGRWQPLWGLCCCRWRVRGACGNVAGTRLVMMGGWGDYWSTRVPR